MTYPYGDDLRFKLSPGEQGISETLAAMAAAVEHTRETGRVPHLARIIAASAWSKGVDPLIEVYEFLRSRVRFKADPIGTEHVRHPDQLLADLARSAVVHADCDDVATLGAALAWALGHRPVFIVTGRRGDVDAKGRVKLKHVFYGVHSATGIMPFDPQERIPPGEWPPSDSVGRIEFYEIFPQLPRAA